MDHQKLVSICTSFRKAMTRIIPYPPPLSAWFFFKIMNVSGAEAVVAAASPWIGQGESACLVRPYVDLMTESEIHLTMTSGSSHTSPPPPVSPHILTSSLSSPFLI